MSAIGESISRARQFLEECWAELKKVTWPTRTETRGATIAVTIAVLIAAAYLWAVDFVFSTAIKQVLE
jgi:preprotein translocase subunit SecE